MNHLKKVLILFVIFLSIFLISCDYEYSLYNPYLRENTEVVLVDYISYFSNEQEVYEQDDFNSEFIQVIESLDDEKVEEFISELSKVGGLAGKFPNLSESPFGKGVKITYSDGSFTIVTVGKINDEEAIFVGNYDLNQKNEHYYSISWIEMIDDFNNVMDSYFDYQ